MQPAKGHVDMLLLAVIGAGPAHGYALIERLRERSAGRLDFPEGTIYPALHRLEREGLVESSWSRVGGRRRRVYALTRRGREALRRESAEWEGLVRAVKLVLQGAA